MNHEAQPASRVSGIVLLLAAIVGTAGCTGLLNRPDSPAASAPRRELSLDGEWTIAEGGMEHVPRAFERKVPVPGLVSQARPPFLEPGPVVKDRQQIDQKDSRRDAFWYRRTFLMDGKIPAVATLKVGKAMFGTRVFLNGQLVGDHRPCFTPGYFDVSTILKAGENELIIRVGADRDAVTRAVPSGFDFEKERYIPGLFDSVTLMLSGTPQILQVQTAPDITNDIVRVEALLVDKAAAAKGPAGSALARLNARAVTFEVREANSGKVVGSATSQVLESGTNIKVVADIHIAGCQLWSPETPFLYTLRVNCGTDSYETRFGMRHFRFDPVSGRAMLNGKPYLMRGSNITLYRFFEDPECGGLPWDEEWVRQLHRKVKGMHWNCLRYCIGFPPEFWYRIADEEGILIQDEFPIWFGGTGWAKWPVELQTEQLATEYGEWMKERWNHPSVVIWDANNETSSDQTGPAIARVRDLDISNRPWDNSYMPPQKDGDVFESHPYHYYNPSFKLAQMEHANPIPQGNPLTNDGTHAVVINEYGWLWLNRDGSPTTLTTNLYRNLLGTNSTTQQRRHLYARYLAADTEFWRAHRNTAAVMHFTALGYSRADGQTSDHWLDVMRLRWEPEFYRYVKDAFAPVGLMVNFWKEKLVGGAEHAIPVVVINDLPQAWAGPVTLRLMSNGRVVQKSSQPCRVEPYGRSVVRFNVLLPEEPGRYCLTAEILGVDRAEVQSLRDFEVVSAAVQGVAWLRRVEVSSVYQPQYAAAFAVDGDEGTYWSSEFRDPAWLEVDLEHIQSINRIQILWERAFAKAFTIEVSQDHSTWTTVHQTGQGQGGENDLAIEPVNCRWVRLSGTVRGTEWGYGVREFQVFSAQPTHINKNNLSVR